MEMILPDCMMPDGADPCLAYQQIVAERDALRALLAEAKNRLRSVEETHDIVARIDAALREEKAGRG